jgi:hypothetical protein
MDIERKTRLGGRWDCSECGTPFYDLCKVVAVCPKCNATQHGPAKRIPAKPRPKAKKAKPRSRSSSQRYLEATQGVAARTPEPLEDDDVPAEVDLDPELAPVLADTPDPKKVR